jgi:uncharacterized protein YqjF (DUF2071 family)
MKRRFLTAEWRNLLMINFEIDPEILRPLVPKGTELDSWGGKTFISLVGFHFLKTKVLGIAVPFHRDFDELNLRFYVRREVDGEVRRGVVFVKEVVPKWAIAAVARWMYNENYVCMPMDSMVQLPDAARALGGSAEFGWGRPPARNFLRAEFDGVPVTPEVGSQEEFITEHYWGYVKQRGGAVLEYRVEHPSWRVWQAKKAHVQCDVPACYGPQFVPALSGEPTSAFVAEGSAVAVYQGDRLGNRA